VSDKKNEIHMVDRMKTMEERDKEDKRFERGA